MRAAFAKYEGSGNAFLLVDRMGDDENSPALSPKHIHHLCDPHRGIGADGVIFVSPPKNTHTAATMELFNADGGRAEISGNGLRCLALWLQHRRRIVENEPCVIATDAGPRQVLFTPTGIRVEMGRARVEWDRPLRAVFAPSFAIPTHSCHSCERGLPKSTLRSFLDEKPLEGFKMDSRLRGNDKVGRPASGLSENAVSTERHTLSLSFPRRRESTEKAPNSRLTDFLEAPESTNPQPCNTRGDSSPILHSCSGQTQNDRGGRSRFAQDDRDGVQDDKEATAVTLGNPHVIIHTPETGSEDLTADIGKACQKSPLFLHGVNVSVYKRVDRATIELTTYERGVGLTPACGSGACAAVAALIHRNELPVGREITVRQPGGVLMVRQDDQQRLWLTGPAHRICEGTAFLCE